MTPSEKYILTVRQFDAEYCMQFFASNGKLLVTIGLEGNVDNSIMMWTPNSDPELHGNEEHVDEVYRLNGQTLEHAWKNIVQIAYRIALDEIFRDNFFD